jgi:hypothetical protein
MVINKNCRRISRASFKGAASNENNRYQTWAMRVGRRAKRSFWSFIQGGVAWVVELGRLQKSLTMMNGSMQYLCQIVFLLTGDEAIVVDKSKLRKEVNIRKLGREHPTRPRESRVSVRGKTR